MWFARVEQLFHPTFGGLRYVLESGMFKPVPGCIFGERKFLQVVSGDVGTQV
jgi:hypothetical protein